MRAAILIVVVAALTTLVSCTTIRRFKTTRLEDQAYWNNLAQAELNKALGLTLNTNVAKNVILFLGDGMSIPTQTAARIYKGQLEGRGGEEGALTFETFPHMGLSKTYAVDKQVPDSANTATAYLTGIKTNYQTIGVDARVTVNDCTSATIDTYASSIAQWAQDAGKRTGVVTSARLTHATPAGAYAHTASRDWECDKSIPIAQQTACPDFKDIARQLIEDEPGRSMNVILGGGYQYFDPNPVSLPGDPVKTSSCIRKDGKVLWQQWIDDKAAAGKSYAFVRSKTQLNQVNTASTENLFGLFSNDHMPYEHEKVEQTLDIPTLAEMTTRALELLSAGPKGYFLLVEGGRIDMAHHDTKGRRALDETVAMDRAIEAALALTSTQDTLIVVTADHSHTLALNGYPARGQDITGLAGKGGDGLPYTTLMYTNGPGYNYSVVDNAGTPEVSRVDLTGVDTTGFEFRQLAPVPLYSETHGGDDVAIYASGPMAHLFHSLHEQNYIAHAMAYAACIGVNQAHCAPRQSAAQVNRRS